MGIAFRQYLEGSMLAAPDTQQNTQEKPIRDFQEARRQWFIIFDSEECYHKCSLGQTKMLIQYLQQHTRLILKLFMCTLEELGCFNDQDMIVWEVCITALLPECPFIPPSPVCLPIPHANCYCGGFDKQPLLRLLHFWAKCVWSWCGT